MSFNIDNQVDKLTFKILAANVIDSNPNKKWYESRFPANPAILSERVLTQFNLIKNYPASDLTTARNNVSLINAQAGNPVIVDLSQASDALRLSRVMENVDETWVVYNDYSVGAESGFADLWVQPQRILTDTTKTPSIGYSAKIYIGDPQSGSAHELNTTEGSGEEVGWVFNYDMGILLFSSEMIDYLDLEYPTWETDGLWVTGFRYVGKVGLDISQDVLTDDSASYHALGKTKTYTEDRIGNELYKSGHNVLSKEVWIDEVVWSANLTQSLEIADDQIVKQIGTPSNPAFLYPLAGSNYRTWFFDNDVPQVPEGTSSGFYPSSGWAKPLINPSDVINVNLVVPSFGYELKMYKPDGTSSVIYDDAFYEVDYFSGFVFFEEGRTPKDENNGLGFVFDSDSFENSVDSLSYIESSTTGGPRAIAWQYVGRMLSDLDFTLTVGTQSGLTYSNNELNINVDNSTIKINDQNQLYVSGSSIYELYNPSNTSGDNSPSGVLIGYDTINYSTIKVVVNGQVQMLGGSINYTSSDCYFYNSLDGVVDLDNIAIGDELYWNGVVAGYDLSTSDSVVFIYETE